MVKSNFARSFLLFGCVALLCGCGDSDTGKKLYPVTGKVVYGDDSPVPGGAIITFVSNSSSHLATAMIQKDGTFTLKSTVGEKEVDGAPAGMYKIYFTVVDPEVPEVPETPEGEIPKEPVEEMKVKRVVAEKYNSPETSGIEKEVKAQEKNYIIIKVEKP